MNTNQIELKVTIEEANLIMEGLGNLPFAKVYQLVANIQQQAGQQLNGESGQRSEPSAESPPSIDKEQAHVE